MKETSTEKKRKIYYLILAVGVLLLTAATVLTVYFVVDGQNNVVQTPPVEQTAPSTPVQPENKPSEPSKPSGGEEAVRFVNPIGNVQVTSGYGFYENQTLGWFYEHQGIDVAAEAGTDVLAMAEGKVESIATDELMGTQIVLSHSDGVKTVYCFVNAAEGLKVGDSVKMGQKIATVAEATGSEYKDGAHLHLEVWENGACVNPTAYLTLDEK